jgi:serine/threonine protein kinase
MPDLIGKTLGGYRVVEQIGLGGMATVYKAYQPSMDRYVALKVISTHLTQDPTFVKRFRQEAKVIAKLEHVHILPVYDHGEEDGYLYLVMRFVEAGTLKGWLARGTLSLEEARQVVNQVGSALEYAHQLDVVHRDLKPSNVLVDPQGDCYLTDFGIAKMVESTLGLTGSSVLGTPHYMAPEQSQSLEVDRRADVYAMGVVIYEMVTGQLPFDAETPLAVVMKHINEPLPLPRSVKPDLPESVERVILKALAKAPDDRYQTMRDLVDAFDRAASAAPTEARAVPPTAPAPPTPTVVEEAEAEPTAVVPGPTPVPTWRRWTAKPLFWLLARGRVGPGGTGAGRVDLEPDTGPGGGQRRTGGGAAAHIDGHPKG